MIGTKQVGKITIAGKDGRAGGLPGGDSPLRRGNVHCAWPHAANGFRKKGERGGHSATSRATASARTSALTPDIPRSCAFRASRDQYSGGILPRRRIALAVPYRRLRSPAKSDRLGQRLMISAWVIQNGYNSYLLLSSKLDMTCTHVCGYKLHHE